eukprot:TRINITY_DN1999_c0_g3_i2.p1 TRINITY_DN1999_c0_g3~~TRINITY_DN1999_c0_g3_i2.p1  ORF type:complete len:314 (+),score=59.79 TRINITY_DN1999_c0_g3_i2:183-1124(+)
MKSALVLLVAICCLLFTVNGEKVTVEGSGAECTLCEFVVGQVEGYVAQNRTEAQIISFLTSDCKILSKPSWVATCQNIVDDFAPTIIEYILNKENPQTICTQLTLCSSSEKVEMVGDTACSLCTYIVNLVENYLQNNATETEILTKLEGDCTILGIPSWINECKSLINVYGPDIVNYLIHNEDPTTVCAQLGLCNNTDVSLPVPPPPKVDVTGSFECLLCEWVVGQVEDYLAGNKTESQILSFLEDECSILKDPKWVSDCKTLITDYAPIIIQMLVNQEPPSTICGQIKLCPSAAPQPKLKPNSLHQTPIHLN